MKYIFITLMMLLLSGCVGLKKSQVPLIATGSIVQQSEQKVKEELFSRGILSGRTILGKNKHITIDSGYLVYDSIFFLEIPRELTGWDYDYNIGNDDIGKIGDFESFGLYDNTRYKTISITVATTGDVRRSQMTIKELCTPDYQEGINYKPNTEKVAQDDTKYFVTYAVFTLPSIDDPKLPFGKNYQAEICFVRDGRLYNIFIGDPKGYRKDIADSFSFL